MQLQRDGPREALPTIRGGPAAHAFCSRGTPIHGMTSLGKAMPDIVRIVVAAAAMLAGLPSARAAPVGYEDTQVLRIESAPGQAVATYGPEQLKHDFPLRVIEIRTPWTGEGEKIRYRGPDLKDVLARNGLNSAPSIEVFAYNDFITTIRMDEIDEYEPILAMERACSAEDRRTGRCRDGEEYTALRLEDAGPYYIVWPFEQLPGSYVFGRNSIWVWFVVALRPAP